MTKITNLNLFIRTIFVFTYCARGIAFLNCRIRSSGFLHVLDDSLCDGRFQLVHGRASFRIAFGAAATSLVRSQAPTRHRRGFFSAELSSSSEVSETGHALLLFSGFPLVSPIFLAPKNAPRCCDKFGAKSGGQNQIGAKTVQQSAAAVHTTLYMARSNIREQTNQDTHQGYRRRWYII